MGYEKPLEKLTFYKAFFSLQWKFLIHTILQRLSAKTTSWNEFNSTMASAIICLATNQKFNFSKYILLNLIKNIEAGVQFYMFPRFVQLINNRQLGDLTHHKGIFDNSSLTKKVFANMKRVGIGFSAEITPLFDNMLIQAPEEVGTLQADEQDIPIPTEPSTSKPLKKHKPKRKLKCFKSFKFILLKIPIYKNTRNLLALLPRKDEDEGFNLQIFLELTSNLREGLVCDMN
ncbi:hypothetical protein Tco_0748482 [Tanacetum coccineum]|uniref:Glutamic acid-rich protein-like n=1 Tax=Tanacetum coccineum TaxID=301880 RepID=A0ABQ4YWY6_9ASTR